MARYQLVVLRRLTATRRSSPCLKAGGTQPGVFGSRYRKSIPSSVVACHVAVTASSPR